ncbi:MAG: SDR family NAD(P)-dependent oxidoreductase, partial [Prevotellaceae bacterium]|nr:SDR family NAD(P)-dependent oxidoreductase [Prevotellaceae bacterium]
MLLEGKTAIITGCLRGIGRTTLDVFMKHGATVFACCEKETDEFNDYVAPPPPHIQPAATGTP